MKIFKKIVITVLVIIISIFAIACSKEEKNNKPKEVNEKIEKEKEEEKIKDVLAYGVIDYTKKQSISVDFNARIDKIHVKEGERIKKGDPLVEFDISELQNNIESKKMEIEETKLELSNNNFDDDRLRLDIETEKINLKKLKDDLVDKANLYNKGAISKDELTKLKNELLIKENNLEKLKLNLKTSLENEKERKQRLNNKLKRLRSELKTLNEKYSKANFTNGNQIVSNIDNGVVVEVNSSEGSYVNRENKVLTIVDLDSRIVKADIAQEFISKIKKGQSATITSQAVPNKEYEGEIVRISGVSTKKSGETIVPIEIKVKNIDDKLFLNFDVDVKIKL
ncbi:MAG: HlyD family secretion protein [Bacillota bacterium]